MSERLFFDSEMPISKTSQTDEIVATKERLERLRHSASHVMAEAVLSLFPGAKLGIGPAIEDGFYYDFDLPRPLTMEDLTAIEAKMREIVAADLSFIYEEDDRQAAQRRFAEQPYKLELIADLGEERYGVYTQGGFTDLCRGPHVPSTGQIGAFKLLSVAGAYWRGDEHRPMLQRIYGTAFETQEEVDAHLHHLEEAARRDHRRLGRELDLYSVHEETGAGLIHWHPKGARVRTIIEDFWRTEHYRAGYDLVYSPHIGKANLWRQSGHLDFYHDNMYSPMDIEGQDYYIKPMNCPFHINIYQSALRSYRELPLRLAELGTVYRYERSGVLHGLMRVRGFTQDDAHIFCRPDQMEAEIEGVIDFTLHMLRAFGFDEYEVYLATRPEKAVGAPELWEQATTALQRAATERGLSYEVDEGGGAFYGPKIDIKIKDALGRAWQCTTIQFDFNLPERFDLNFIGDDGREHRPYMIHRALLGSLERFFGVLVEHYAGAFPVWLAPVQAAIIPISDRHLDYARQVEQTLRQADVRVELDASSERMQAKIRRAQLAKVPYMLVLGDAEVSGGTVAVRQRSGENHPGLSLDGFLEMLRQAVAARV